MIDFNMDFKPETQTNKSNKQITKTEIISVKYAKKLYEVINYNNGKFMRDFYNNPNRTITHVSWNFNKMEDDVVNTLLYLFAYTIEYINYVFDTDSEKYSKQLKQEMYLCYKNSSSIKIDYDDFTDRLENIICILQNDFKEDFNDEEFYNIEYFIDIFVDLIYQYVLNKSEESMQDEENINAIKQIKEYFLQLIKETELNIHNKYLNSLL